MKFSPTRRRLTLVAVLCVVTIFFFPPIQGPFSTTHGPVTALQSVRAARKISASLVHAARHTTPRRVVVTVSEESCRPTTIVRFQPATVPGMAAPLRC